jgi:hypothetical protein
MGLVKTEQKLPDWCGNTNSTHVGFGVPGPLLWGLESIYQSEQAASQIWMLSFTV